MSSNKDRKGKGRDIADRDNVGHQSHQESSKGPARIGPFTCPSFVTAQYKKQQDIIEEFTAGLDSLSVGSDSTLDWLDSASWPSSPNPSCEEPQTLPSWTDSSGQVIDLADAFALFDPMQVSSTGLERESTPRANDKTPVLAPCSLPEPFVSADDCIRGGSVESEGQTPKPSSSQQDHAELEDADKTPTLTTVQLPSGGSGGRESSKGSLADRRQSGSSLPSEHLHKTPTDWLAAIMAAHGHPAPTSDSASNTRWEPAGYREPVPNAISEGNFGYSRRLGKSRSTNTAGHVRQQLHQTSQGRKPPRQSQQLSANPKSSCTTPTETQFAAILAALQAGTLNISPSPSSGPSSSVAASRDASPASQVGAAQTFSVSDCSRAGPSRSAMPPTSSESSVPSFVALPGPTKERPSLKETACSHCPDPLSLKMGQPDIPMLLPPPEFLIVSDPYGDLPGHLKRHGCPPEAEVARSTNMPPDYMLHAYLTSTYGGPRTLLDQSIELPAQHRTNLERQLGPCLRTSSSKVSEAAGGATVATLPEAITIDSDDLDMEAVRCQIIPTHILILQPTIQWKGKSQRCGVFAVHRLPYVLQCMTLPSMPVIDHATPHITGALDLPIVVIGVPRPEYFLLTHRFIYLRDTEALFADLFPTSAAVALLQARAKGSHQDIGAVHELIRRLIKDLETPECDDALRQAADVLSIAMTPEVVIRYIERIHASWANGFAIGFIPPVYWKVIAKAWKGIRLTWELQVLRSQCVLDAPLAPPIGGAMATASFSAAAAGIDFLSTGTVQAKADAATPYTSAQSSVGTATSRRSRRPRLQGSRSSTPSAGSDIRRRVTQRTPSRSTPGVTTLQQNCLQQMQQSDRQQSHARAAGLELTVPLAADPISSNQAASDGDLTPVATLPSSVLTFGDMQADAMDFTLPMDFEFQFEMMHGLGTEASEQAS